MCVCVHVHISTHSNILQHTPIHPGWEPILIIVPTVTTLFNTLQHTAKKLQHTATHCNTLQHTATHCNTRRMGAGSHQRASSENTLQHIATHCNTLQHTATHCNTRRMGAGSHQRVNGYHISPTMVDSIGMGRVVFAVCCSVLQRVAACCSVLQCVAVF